MKDHNEKYVIRVEIMFVRVFMKDSLEKECVKHHCNSFSALMLFVCICINKTLKIHLLVGARGSCVYLFTSAHRARCYPAYFAVNK